MKLIIAVTAKDVEFSSTSPKSQESGDERIERGDEDGEHQDHLPRRGSES